MKTILWVSHSGRADGGAELSLCSILESAQKRGYRQHVVIPSAEGLERKLKDLSVDYSIVPFTWWEISGTKNWQDLKNNYRSVGRLYGLIRHLNCGLVITNTMVHPWAALASARAGVAHVWMVREFGNSDHGLRFILGQRATYWFIDKFSSLIVANSQAVKRHLLNFIKSSKKLIVSYPVVTVPRFGRKTNNRGKGRFEIIMVGSVRESKGQLEVVKALCLLPPSIQSNIGLTLVGPYQDSERQKIETFLHEKNKDKNLVKFLGSQNNPLKFLSRAELYIVASRNEAFGRATVEAMAAGLPVIGKRSGGTPEVVLDGETGLLYAPGDLGALSSAILKLVRNPHLRLRMGRDGMKRMREVFNESEVSEQFFSKLDKLPAGSMHIKVKYLPAFLAIITLTTIACLARFTYRSLKSLLT